MSSKALLCSKFSEFSYTNPVEMRAHILEVVLREAQAEGKAGHDLHRHCMALVHEIQHLLPAGIQTSGEHFGHTAILAAQQLIAVIQDYLNSGLRHGRKGGGISPFG